MEFPRGPSSFPTKLNCVTGEKKAIRHHINASDIRVGGNYDRKKNRRETILENRVQQEGDPFGEKVKHKRHLPAISHVISI